MNLVSFYCIVFYLEEILSCLIWWDCECKLMMPCWLILEPGSGVGLDDNLSALSFRLELFRAPPSRLENPLDNGELVGVPDITENLKIISYASENYYFNLKC